MIGVDEVGRGAWAGPLLVVAARLKAGKALPPEVKDSKQLQKRDREKLMSIIVDACDIGEGWISADIIDEKGLSDCLKSACMLAVLRLEAKPNEKIVIDGSVDFLKNTQYQQVVTKIKADETVRAVSAASIAAKVLRDQLMSEYADDFPEYGFESHVGYGTKKHQAALKMHGITTIHRRSFKPLREL